MKGFAKEKHKKISPRHMFMRCIIFCGFTVLICFGPYYRLFRDRQNRYFQQWTMYNKKSLGVYHVQYWLRSPDGSSKQLVIHSPDQHFDRIKKKSALTKLHQKVISNYGNQGQLFTTVRKSTDEGWDVILKEHQLH